MKVAVVGCGYVGLVSAVGLATLGHDVVGIDADDERLGLLRRGVPPFAEPGLAEALAAAIDADRLAFSGALDDVAEASVILLCVQTPPGVGGAVELVYLERATRALADALASSPDRRRVVAVRSTVPPGTNEELVAPMLAPAGTAVVSNPEFLREGSALDDFLRADRVVVGTRADWAAETMRELYSAIDAPLIVTTPATAELAKYVSNALLAALISFSNEIGRICEATPGVDVEDVLGIVHRDRRLTTRQGATSHQAPIVSYLKAGCGYGGSCLPKDIAALSSYARAHGESTELLDAVASVNHGQAARLVDLAERKLGPLPGRVVAVLGAAFKAGTDDLRESPALRVVEEVLGRGARVVVYDPLVPPERLAAALSSDNVGLAPTLEAALDGADACLVTTQAPEFDELARIVAERNGTAPVVVDGRRSLAADRFAEEGYIGIGRGRGS